MHSQFSILWNKWNLQQDYTYFLVSYRTVFINQSILQIIKLVQLKNILRIKIYLGFLKNFSKACLLTFDVKHLLCFCYTDEIREVKSSHSYEKFNCKRKNNVTKHKDFYKTSTPGKFTSVWLNRSIRVLSIFP